MASTSLRPGPSGLGPRALGWLAIAALAVAIATRVNNAFRYKILWGFDALFNWAYIRYLKTSWALPHPEAGWSTAKPPLFYYLSGAVCRIVDSPEREPNVVALRLLIAAIGLVMAFLALLLVRRIDPADRPRALLAGGLVLFLPVHVYMSAMVTEEILVATLVSVVLVGVCLDLAAAPDRRAPLRSCVGLGVVAGLALLTKLTGALIVVAVVCVYLLDGWRRRAVSDAARRAASIALVAALVGGWFYARNWIEYGYLYPHGLPKHEVMYSMPPGERHMSDYIRIPLSIWRDPQLLDPDLLRSVWGSTYVTMWFDGHRAFLPTDTPAVTRVGVAILLLALLPMTAFVVGLRRGIARSGAGSGPDTLLLTLVVLTLAGYVLFTWRNPWFAVHKASFLLSLTLPYAFYTSEVLIDWLRKPRGVGLAVGGVLGLLAVLVTATFTFSRLFWNMDHMAKTGVAW